jgi:hypothetical protein
VRRLFARGLHALPPALARGAVGARARRHRRGLGELCRSTC